MKHSLASASLVSLLCITGCGGGGGGGEQTAPAPPPGPTLVTFNAPATIRQSADAGVGQNPLYEFDVTLSSVPPEDRSPGYSYTSNGVNNVAFFYRTDTEYHGIVYFDDPADIGPGVYRDSITIGMCVDDDCTALQAGTTRTISITYTITGTVPPPVSASASTQTVNVEARAFSSTQPIEYIDLTYQNVRANQSLDITATSAYHGLGGALYERISETAGRVKLTFKNSATLAPGTYDDVVTINVCQGNKCPQQVAGAPITVNTRYVVNGTVAGPNGYTIRAINQEAVDLDWNAGTARLYLAVPPGAAQNANSIVALDPALGTLGPGVVVGNFPTHVVTSDDGQFAYVVSRDFNDVKRFTLPALAADITIPAGSDADGPLAAHDIEVAPGQAHTIAMIQMRPYPNGGRTGVAIYDDATPRPRTFEATYGVQFPVHSLQWNGTSGLYGNLYGSPSDFSVFAVDGRGLSLSALQTVTAPEQVGGAMFQLENGLVYFDRGVQYDPATASILGIYQAEDVPQFYGPKVAGMVADAGYNRTYALVRDSFNFYLQSFDLATHQRIATVSLDGLTFEYNTTNEVLRWGEDGLALATTDGRVVLINGAFVKP